MTILNWLATEFNTNKDNILLSPLAGDASMRCYYRCRINGQKYIVMQETDELSFNNFVKIAKHLKSWGISAPNIYKTSYKEKLLVTSDLGDELYFNLLNNKTADSLYRNAIDSLLIMQQKNADEVIASLQLSKMEDDYIADKLEVFKTWFLQHHLQLHVNEKIDNLFKEIKNLFCEAYAAQPQVFVHLDYHSRNLLMLPDGSNGVIDFQDAMIGPLTYDLVSLLQDAYITWPREKISMWVSEYQKQAYAKGIIGEIDSSKFMELFDIVGLQRHLKNLGVFARLCYRDGKPQYLQHIPTLINYVLDACHNYKSLSSLQKFFTEQVITLVKSHELVQDKGLINNEKLL